MSDNYPVIPENLPEHIKWLKPKTDFVTVGDDVYCSWDRYQCRVVARVPNFDKFVYCCNHCGRMFDVMGQDFVDWCAFRGEVRRYVDEGGTESEGNQDHSS